MSTSNVAQHARLVRAHFHPNRPAGSTQYRIQIEVSAPDNAEIFNRSEAERLCHRLLELASEYVSQNSLGRCELCGCDELKCECSEPCANCARVAELFTAAGAPRPKAALELSVSDIAHLGAPRSKSPK